MGCPDPAGAKVRPADLGPSTPGTAPCFPAAGGRPGPFQATRTALTIHGGPRGRARRGLAGRDVRRSPPDGDEPHPTSQGVAQPTTDTEATATIPLVRAGAHCTLAKLWGRGCGRPEEEAVN